MSLFARNEEHQLLQNAAKEFIRDRGTVQALRRIRDDGRNAGMDRKLWAEMVELGWTGILISENYGGSDLGFVGMGIVLEEAGRGLAPTPLLGTALIAPSALRTLGSAAQQQKWLPRLATGQVVFATAIDETPHHDPAKTRLEAAPDGEVWRLTGEKMSVPDGHIADALLVLGRLPDGGLQFFVVETHSEGLEIAPLSTIDSLGAADIRFRAVRCEGLENSEAGAVEGVLDIARIGLAAEMLGQAQQAFELTVDYLSTRLQFGQVIGAFQALQHRAARMAVELELTRSAVMAALGALDTGHGNIPQLASLAKARAGETLHQVSNEMVQLHGGIGMTDAHDAGLFLKRARVLEAQFGSAAFHRNRYAALLGA